MPAAEGILAPAAALREEDMPAAEGILALAVVAAALVAHCSAFRVAYGCWQPGRRARGSGFPAACRSSSSQESHQNQHLSAAPAGSGTATAAGRCGRLRTDAVGFKLSLETRGRM